MSSVPWLTGEVSLQLKAYCAFVLRSEDRVVNDKYVLYRQCKEYCMYNLLVSFEKRFNMPSSKRRTRAMFTQILPIPNTTLYRLHLYVFLRPPIQEKVNPLISSPQLPFPWINPYRKKA